MPQQPLSIPFDSQIDAAIAWGRQRVAVLPDDYYGSLAARARSRAFTVSGLAAMDQIQGVLDSLNAATANGESFDAWRRTLKPEAIALGRAQLSTIFRNGIQTHYNIGHWQNQVRHKATRPLLMYDAINDGRTRPNHRALDGYIAPVDDPAWQRIYPPNGHNCRCKTISLTDTQAKARGYKGHPDPVPAEPDDGWAYNPGAGSEEAGKPVWGRVQGQDAALADTVIQRLLLCPPREYAAKKRGQGPMIWCDGLGFEKAMQYLAVAEAAGSMPEPRIPAGIERLSAGLTEQALFDRFMEEFGGGRRQEFTDIIGNELEISSAMFENIKGGWKITKGERAQWLLYTALNIKAPDEIWLEPGRHGGPDRLYYMSQFDVQRRGELLSTLAVFDREQDSTGLWIGRTNYGTTQNGYAQRKRNKEIKNGVLRYWRRD